MPRPARRYLAQALPPPQTSPEELPRGEAGRAEAAADATASRAPATSSLLPDPPPRDSCSSPHTPPSRDPSSCRERRRARVDRVPRAIKRSQSASRVGPRRQLEVGGDSHLGEEVDKAPFRDCPWVHTPSQCTTALLSLRIPVPPRVAVDTVSRKRVTNRNCVCASHWWGDCIAVSCHIHGGGALRIPACRCTK